MKNSLKIVATILSILLFIFFSYRSFYAYKAYKISQSADKYISNLYRSDSLIDKLEYERLLSALYLGTHGNFNFDTLKEARKKSDEVIANAKDFIQKEADFLDSLQYVRSRVDVISDKHQDILFKYYQNELSNKILNYINHNINELSIGIIEIKKELQSYKNALNYKNKINEKGSFIAYILSSSKKLKDNDLKILDHIFEEDNFIKEDIPYFDLNTKVAIIKGIQNGDYGITYQEWLSKIKKEIQKITKIKKEQFYKIQSKLKKIVASPQDLITNLLIALSFLIISLFLIKSILTNNTSNRVVIRKDRRKSDKNSKDDEDRYIVLKYQDSEKKSDLVETQEIKFSKTAIRSFNPLNKFTNVAKLLKEETKKRDIDFKESIDSEIPTISIGNVSKIDEILNILVDHILSTTTSDDIIEYKAENIAQTKLEDAIKLTFYQASASTKELEQEDKITLVKLKKLANIINGTFKIEDNRDGGVNFLVTLNLKKGS